MSKKDLSLKSVVQQIGSKTRCPWGRCSSRHQNQLIWGHALTRPVPFSAQRPFILGARAIIAPSFSFGANRLGRSYRGHQYVMGSSGISTHLGAPAAKLPHSTGAHSRSSFPARRWMDPPAWESPRNHLIRHYQAGRGQKTSKMGLNKTLSQPPMKTGMGQPPEADFGAVSGVGSSRRYFKVASRAYFST